jgi:hypothetical protein
MSQLGQSHENITDWVVLTNRKVLSVLEAASPRSSLFLDYPPCVCKEISLPLFVRPSLWDWGLTL